MSGDRLRAGAEEIAARLTQAGYRSLLAGGCVRDRLLGLEPKDYDLATAAPPEAVQACFPRSQPVGAAFGVVLVRLKGRRSYEVATFRRDGAYLDGRRPEAVAYTTDPEEDVRRRDFTVNALLEDPASGEVLDYVGGRADLAAGLIRAVGEPAERFAEDRLRMLRAVRFAARLGFEIEAQTQAAICAHAAALGEVSPERVDQELRGVLGGARPGLGGRLLAATGLIDAIDPAVAAQAGRWQPQLARLEGAGLDPDRQATLGFALLYLDQAPEPVAEALTGLRQSKARVRETAHLVEAYGLLRRPEACQVAAGLRLAAGPDAEALQQLLDAADGPGAPAPQAFAQARAALKADPLPPRPLLSGADLKALGLRPGPAFKALLQAVDDAVLERRLTDKAAAEDWVRSQPQA